MTPQFLETRALASDRDRVLNRERYRQRLERARQVSWLSLGMMGVLGGLAALAGIIAGSVSLLGFGVASAIEACASAIMVARLKAERPIPERAERWARRVVGVQFLLLAASLAFASIHVLLDGDHATTSLLGITLALAGLAGMPELGTAMRQVTTQFGSPAAQRAARPSAFGYLAGALLLGLLGNAFFGLWWLDPLVGMLVAAIALLQGLMSWSS